MSSYKEVKELATAPWEWMDASPIRFTITTILSEKIAISLDVIPVLCRLTILQYCRTLVRWCN